MEAKRLEANDSFKAGNLEEAIQRYCAAVAMFYAAVEENRPVGSPTSPTSAQIVADLASMKEEAIKCFGNLCVCTHKLKKYDDCREFAAKVLCLNPHFAKGYAFLAMCDFDENPTALRVRCRRYRELCTAVNLLPAMQAQVEGRQAEYRSQLRDAILAMQSSSPPSSPNKALEEALLGEGDVEIKSVGAGRGRGVVAKRDLMMHTVVASLDAPFSVGYYDDWTPQKEKDATPPKLCVLCGASTVTEGTIFSDCPGCHGVCYCSEICAAGYAERHALECLPFQKLRMVKNTLLESNQPDLAAEAYELGSHVITTISGLMMKRLGSDAIEKLDGHDAEVAQSLDPIPNLIFDILPDHPQSLVAHVLGVIRCNAVQLVDETGLSVGQALYTTTVTFFNHSCCPNAALDVENRIVRCIQPIEAGEEITISYIPQLYWPRDLRQEGLKERYFFGCKCDRCEAGKDGAAALFSPAKLRGVTGAAFSTFSTLERLLTSPGSNPTRSNPTKYFHSIVQNIVEGVRSRTVEEVDESLLKEVQSLKADVLKELHPLHYLVQDLRNAETFVASALQRPHLAFDMCREELNFWEMVVPGALPIKADKLRNMARCIEVAKSQQSSAADAPPTPSIALTPAEVELWQLYDVSSQRK